MWSAELIALGPTSLSESLWFSELTLGIGSESLLLGSDVKSFCSHPSKPCFQCWGLIFRGLTLSCSDRESASLQKPAAFQRMQKHAWNFAHLSQKLRLGNLRLNYDEFMFECLNCCVSARCGNTYQHLESGVERLSVLTQKQNKITTNPHHFLHFWK